MLKILLSALVVGICFGNTLPIHYGKTMRQEEGQLLEKEFHRLTQSTKPKSLTYPRPCFSTLDSLDLCNSNNHLRWEERQNRWIELGGAWSYELRNLDISHAEKTDYGWVEQSENTLVTVQNPEVRVRAQFEELSAWADVRIFWEDHQQFTGSFDSQFIEMQTEGVNSNLNFVSYARFIGGLHYKSPIGELGAGRHAVHWGPMLRYPMMFGSATAPFNNLSYQVHLGPFTVTSLYGDLDIGSKGRFTSALEEKSVYGHRYEWRIHPRFTLALSEALFLYELSEPFAFIPVFPLFMYKGQTREPNNNGNLALDFSFYTPPYLRVYGEFLIDDMSEPSSLFDDFSGNKWGASLGAQVAYPLQNYEVGSVIEWTRVEPYVYSHYLEKTAQATHFDQPVGNPLGPNAMGLYFKNYLRFAQYYFGFGQEWIWKGKDFGSSVLDALPDNEEVRKEFLGSANPMKWKLLPEVVYFREFFSLQVWADLNLRQQTETDWFLRLTFSY